MIAKLQLLRNIGQFDSVTAGATLSFERLVLAYAENGRGKTTLAAVLRSLATGDPLPLTERHRLSAQHPAHAIVDCAGGPPLAIFENGAWNRTLANVAIFDDAFVDENIYSGLTVAPEHRQRLHELVLGAQGVILHRNVDTLVAKIEAHNVELRARQAAIPAGEMGPFSADDFCALPSQADVDIAIKGVDRKIAAVKEQDPVRRGQLLDTLSLPGFDVKAIAKILAQDVDSLDTTAAERVRHHLENLGSTAEWWISEGLQHVPASQDPIQAAACPFCLQDLAGSSIIGHYRAYFSAEYTKLTRSVADTVAAVNREHGDDVPAAFERAVRVAVERRQFWAKFCEVPEVSLDTAEIARAWKAARDGVVSLLEKKQARPLDPLEFSASVAVAVQRYDELRTQVSDLNSILQQANASIRLVKEQAAAGNAAALESDRARLKATKARHTPEISDLCARYTQEKAAKAKTADERDKAKAALEQYRTNVFPTYRQSINGYLQRFNAGFRIDSISAVTSRGGTACNYTVLIDNKPVAVAGGIAQPGSASFRNTLSAGDRNTLALAFFFASLEQDPGLATKTVVIDDPLTSLDEHRSLTTVQEIRRLTGRVAQVIVLSHDRRFLARIWDSANERIPTTAFQIVRDGQGSTFAAWNVSDDATTEYDRRHSLLREYLASGRGDAREVAEAIRPVLEGFERVAHPEHFPPGSLLGLFLGICNQRVGTNGEILVAKDVQELEGILEYANRFHHDTNPAWQTETVNDGELHGFVTRTLAFVRR
ncbi:MAG: AAA family ATPase [Phycisphaerae bacterium]|nr:AAA family ATPase [Phycisphaerae bacterium]